MQFTLVLSQTVGGRYPDFTGIADVGEKLISCNGMSFLCSYISLKFDAKMNQRKEVLTVYRHLSVILPSLPAILISPFGVLGF